MLAFWSKLIFDCSVLHKELSLHKLNEITVELDQIDSYVGTIISNKPCATTVVERV